MSDKVEIQAVSLLCGECVKRYEELGDRVPIEFMIKKELPCEKCGKMLTREEAHSAYIGKTEWIEGKVVGNFGGSRIIVSEIRQSQDRLKTKFTLDQG